MPRFPVCKTPRMEGKRYHRPVLGPVTKKDRKPRINLPPPTCRNQRIRPVDDEKSKFYVQGIVDDDKDFAGETIYRIRWWGYKPYEDTWEPAAEIPLEFVQVYEDMLAGAEWVEPARPGSR